MSTSNMCTTCTILYLLIFSPYLCTSCPISETSGYITSPGYPSPYAPALDECWILRAPAGQVGTVGIAGIVGIAGTVGTAGVAGRAGTVGTRVKHVQRV